MTDYEADNPSSLPTSAPVGHSWKWLSDRLSPSAVERLDNWMQSELELLESSNADSITARSLKRDMRHEFTSSKRTTP